MEIILHLIPNNNQIWPHQTEVISNQRDQKFNDLLQDISSHLLEIRHYRLHSLLQTRL